MSSALALVLVSALLHASWNLLAKGVRGVYGVAWWYALVGSLAFAPMGVTVWLRTEWAPSLLGWGFLVGSALLHVGYFTTLQRAYGSGDLSLVYPLARGSGPALSVVAAVVLLGERPGVWGWWGAGLVALAAFGLAQGAGSQGSRRAVALGLLTGVFIAAYTLWDAVAVTRVGVPVALFVWLSEVLRAVALSPMAWRDRDEVVRVWRTSRGALVGVGVLSPLAYLMVLWALTFAPVSIVAPLREVSLLMGVVLGAGLLGEGVVRRRLLAAAVMVVGVGLLSVALP